MGSTSTQPIQTQGADTVTTETAETSYTTATCEDPIQCADCDNTFRRGYVQSINPGQQVKYLCSSCFYDARQRRPGDFYVGPYRTII